MIHRGKSLILLLMGVFDRLLRRDFLLLLDLRVSRSGWLPLGCESLPRLGGGPIGDAGLLLDLSPSGLGVGGGAGFAFADVPGVAGSVPGAVVSVVFPPSQLFCRLPPVHFVAICGPRQRLH